MRLTRELVDRVPPGGSGEPFATVPEGMRAASEAELEAIVSDILQTAPDRRSIWVFAYGSLIWKPAFDSDDHRIALARGWRRRFCLGWDRLFRGCEERPGLMLALDRGGQCTGIAYHVPSDRQFESLMALARREMRLLPHPFPPRWLRLETAQGPLTGLGFVIDRRSGRFIDGLDLDETARILATASGPAGSMAEYLRATVEHLHAHGVRDRILWNLQEKVAVLLEDWPAEPRG